MSRSGRSTSSGAGAPTTASRRWPLRRFGSVTVLNGHIHQVMQKVEGNLAFHTAMSTAFPQPAPGTAASPGPIGTCRPAACAPLLGITQIREAVAGQPLAIIDTPLGA